ncbi:dihydrodipicolinate synthase family protein [Agromyces fucosus]|uniref:Dihydrodipicolinate synthase family protein n=1 Tax=Agromyces fucosus TaxID=41985 RepID=A0A4Q2JMT8_9MICO|nr:dihydrodipicolinate synthase family protein [Agromyces fucosus]
MDRLVSDVSVTPATNGTSPTNGILDGRLFAALVTPTRSDESVDLDAFARLADSDITRGVEGLYIGGSSGEGLLLSEAERGELTRTAVEVAAGRVPVVTHVGALSTGESRRLALAAQSAGAAAVSMIPPPYYRYSTDDVAAHFRSVIDSIDVPFLVYNIPQFTGLEISDGGFESILELPQVIGVKHTSNNLYGAERMLQRYPHLTLVNGFDEIYLPALSVGARGAIGTTVGIQIELFRSLRARFERGDMDAARLVQRRINDTVEAMVAANVFGAAKFMSGKRVGELGHCRAPLPRVSDRGIHDLEAAWTRLQADVEATAAEDAAGA